MMCGKGSITIAAERMFEGNWSDDMSVLAIDIGNSRVGFNVFTGGKAQDEAVRLAHGDLDKELAGTLQSLWEKCERETKENEDDDAEVVITSVVPSLTDRVAYSARQYLDA